MGMATQLGIRPFFISVIRPDIRFHLPDNRPEKAVLNEKLKTNKITTKHIPEPFQYVES